MNTHHHLFIQEKKMLQIAACHIKDEIPSLGSLKLDRQSSEVTSLSMSVTMEIRPTPLEKGLLAECLKTKFSMQIEMEKERTEKVILDTNKLHYYYIREY